MRDVTTPYIDMLVLNLTGLDLVTLTLPYMDMSRVYHVTYDVIELNIMHIIEYYLYNLIFLI